MITCRLYRLMKRPESQEVCCESDVVMTTAHLLLGVVLEGTRPGDTIWGARV